MARRITTGAVGGAVGGLNITNTTLSTADNLDIAVSPSGTGVFSIEGNAQLEAQGDLRFADADSSNYIALQAPATIASNITFTLPSTDGTSSQSLITDGSGVLSFGSSTVAVTDNTTDSNIYNVVVTTANSGSVAGITVSSTKLRYQPSTGTVFSESITGNSTESGTLILRSTSNATKGRVIIDETTASTSATTGALTVAGGVGIAGRLNVGGVFAALGGSSGINNFNIITTTTSLADADAAYFITATTPYTITLPATTTDGRTIEIIDGGNFASINVVLGRNGNTIGGVENDLVLNVSSSFRLVYYQGNWRLDFYNT